MIVLFCFALALSSTAYARPSKLLSSPQSNGANNCLGKTTFRLGVLLPSIVIADEELNQPVAAVEMAANQINADETLLPNACIEIVANDTSDGLWETMEAALWQINAAKVDAIIGPAEGSTTQVVSPIAAEAGVPLLTPSAVSFDTDTSILLHPTFFRVSPYDLYLEQVVQETLGEFTWTKVAVIVTRDNYRAQAIANTFTGDESRIDVAAFVYLHEPHNELDATEIQQLRRLKDADVSIFVVAVAGSELNLVLSVAAEAGLMDVGYAWIVVWCNYGTDVFDERTMNGILCIRQRVDSNVTTALWEKFASQPFSGIGYSPWLDSVHAYDATMAVAQVINDVQSMSPRQQLSDSLDFRPLPSPYAHSVLRQLRQGNFTGMSGSFDFSAQQASTYDILNYNDGEMLSVATWTQNDRFNSMDNVTIRWPGNTTVVPTGFSVQSDSVINALIPMSWPFTGLRHKTTGENCEHLPPENHTDCTFQGVAIELMEKIANSETIKAKLKYHLWRQGWTDMVKVIGNDSTPYDMAIGSVTVTEERASYAVFTRSIYTSGIRILTARPQTISPGLAEFFKPFEWAVWLLIVVALLVCAVVIMYLDPSAVVSEPPKVYNEMSRAKRLFHSWVDSTYFSFATFFFVQQQENVNNIFARILLVMLCFFVLIIVGAYTANMAAFLTNRPHMTEMITDYKDLIGRSVIARKGTASVPYVQEELNLGGNLTLVRTGDKAVELLKSNKGDAYISDTPHVLGLAAGDCDVIVVGSQEQQQFYAFPTKTNFRFREQINKEIAAAIDEEFVTNTLQKVLNNQCPPVEEDSESHTDPISIRDVAGLFVVSAVAASLFVFFKAVYHVGVRSRRSKAENFNIYFSEPEYADVPGGEPISNGTYSKSMV